MVLTLTEYLANARAYARLVGGVSAEEIAPGVLRAEAEIAAWHARAVQGGYSTPFIEAERLSADRGGIAPIDPPKED